MFVAEPILEEANHHAEIAWRKLRQWCEENRKRRSSTSKKERAASLPSDNVFLRSYKCRAGDRASRSGAEEYLSNFLAEKEKGSARLRRLVVDEFGLNVLPGLQVDKSFAARVTKELLSEQMRGCYDEEQAKMFKRRSECDGRLLASLAARRKSSGSPQFVAIVSMSPRLRRVCENHVAELGMQSAVIRLSRLTFALTLLPRSSLSLSGLRTVLFDPYFGTQVSPSYELAERLLQSESLGRHELSGKLQLTGKLDRALAGS